MNAATLWLELRRSRGQAIAYALVLAVYGGFVAALYPTIRDQAALLDQYMKILPEALRKAFSISGTSISSPGTFFGVEFFGLVWPIVAAMFAIGLGTRPVAGEAAQGTIEAPLATPLPRTRYLLSAFGAQVIGLVVLATAAVAGVLVVGGFVEADLPTDRMALVGVDAFAFGAAIAGVAAFAAVLTLDRGRAIGACAIVLIAMYLFNFLALTEERLDSLKYLSAFHYFRPAAVIDSGVVPLGEMGLFAIAAILGWALAVWRFRTRDLAA